MTNIHTLFRKTFPAQSDSDRSATSLATENVAFLKPEQTLVRLHNNPKGLTAAEARERLADYGRNEVAHDNAPPAFIQFVLAFNNPFIYVLMALAAVSMITGKDFVCC